MPPPAWLPSAPATLPSENWTPGLVLKTLGFPCGGTSPSRRVLCLLFFSELAITPGGKTWKELFKTILTLVGGHPASPQPGEGPAP